MHDASDGVEVWPCSREPARGNQCLGRSQDAHDDSMGTVVLDDRRDGEAAVHKAASRLEYAAQTAPRGSARLPAGRTPRTSTSQHG